MVQITANNLVAYFTGPKPWQTQELPVIGWNENDQPLVWDDKTKRLRRADEFNNFAGIGESMEGESSVVAVLPTNGWRYRCKKDEEDGGGYWDFALNYFAVKADGSCQPVSLDYDGWGTNVRESENFDCIYHPDQPDTWPDDFDAKCVPSAGVEFRG